MTPRQRAQELTGPGPRGLWNAGLAPGGRRLREAVGSAPARGGEGPGQAGRGRPAVPVYFNCFGEHVAPSHMLPPTSPESSHDAAPVM